MAFLVLSRLENTGAGILGLSDRSYERLAVDVLVNDTDKVYKIYVKKVIEKVIAVLKNSAYTNGKNKSNRMERFCGYCLITPAFMAAGRR